MRNCAICFAKLRNFCLKIGVRARHIATLIRNYAMKIWRNDIKMRASVTIYGYKSPSVISITFHKVIDVLRVFCAENIHMLFKNMFPNAIEIPCN